MGHFWQNQIRPPRFLAQVDSVMPNLQRCDVVLLNDDQTPMEFVVYVLERFFDMTKSEAEAHMLRSHYEGKAICGAYPYEEAEKKVADVLAFAREHSHPLQCVLERAD
jgi:ATP-dependent Clp protease adaptor protein ClpS